MDWFIPFLVAAAMPLFVVLGICIALWRAVSFCVSAIRSAIGAATSFRG